MALCAAIIAAGHPWHRLALMVWLMAALPLCLLWPRWRASAGLRVAAGLWLLAFGVDAVVRGYLRSHYGMAPDSSLVIVALANTTPGESVEFLQSHWRDAVPWAALLLPAALAPLLLALTARQPLAQPSLAARRWLVALLVVAWLPYALKPMRRHHPLLAWPAVAEATQAQRARWADQAQQHQRWLDQARAAVAAPAPVPSTVVLVLSDSINRDNLQLYGYPRATSPGLLQAQRALGESFAVVRDAWSLDAATVPALQRMLVHGQGEQQQHLLALARAAGYRVWWVSNHDDLAVKNLHGRLADSLVLLNRQPGRSTQSLDDVVLPALRQALADPAPRKFIVLHLLGAHQHYALRYPAGHNPFDDAPDAVDAAMRAAGRPAWLRRQRADYDAALRHHDALVSQTLALTRQVAERHAAWVFTADHGQEVGHEKNHAGHSPATAAGFRIPLVLWRREPWPVAQPGQRPFRADAFTPLMAAVLQLPADVARHPYNPLAEDYRWELPAELARFGPDPARH